MNPMNSLTKVKLDANNFAKKSPTSRHERSIFQNLPNVSEKHLISAPPLDPAFGQPRNFSKRDCFAPIKKTNVDDAGAQPEPPAGPEKYKKPFRFDMCNQNFDISEFDEHATFALRN